MTQPEIASLDLMRLKDPNEALGLAVRLLAGEAPFRDMPLGFSAGAIISSIDREEYVFARRGERALGIAYWMFVEPGKAEAWISEGKRLEAADRLDSSLAAIIMGVQASEPAVAKYLMRCLRNGELAQCDVCYFVRDYGKGKGSQRAMRLVRPKSERQASARVRAEMQNKKS